MRASSALAIVLMLFGVAACSADPVSVPATTDAIASSDETKDRPQAQPPAPTTASAAAAPTAATTATTTEPMTLGATEAAFGDFRVDWAGSLSTEVVCPLAPVDHLSGVLGVSASELQVDHDDNGIFGCSIRYRDYRIDVHVGTQGSDTYLRRDAGGSSEAPRQVGFGTGAWFKGDDLQGTRWIDVANGPLLWHFHGHGPSDPDFMLNVAGVAELMVEQFPVSTGVVTTGPSPADEIAPSQSAVPADDEEVQLVASLFDLPIETAQCLVAYGRANDESSEAFAAGIGQCNAGRPVIEAMARLNGLSDADARCLASSLDDSAMNDTIETMFILGESNGDVEAAIRDTVASLPQCSG